MCFNFFFPENSSTIAKRNDCPFIRSLGLYFCWFLQSFWPNKDNAAPLSKRRILFLIIGMPLFLGLQMLHWLGFLIDEIFFALTEK